MLSDKGVRHDPRFAGVIRSRESLIYDSAIGSAKHVRGASGLCVLGDELCVIQDDASLIGIRTRDGRVRPVELPWAPGGHRVFEERLGNKLDKLDFEACVALSRSSLCALGSGSTPVRERLVIVERGEEPRLIEASPLYAAIREALDLERHELNLEGAVIARGVLRLFQRGNAGRSPRAGPATVDLELAAFEGYVESGGASAVPSIIDVTRWDLGEQQGISFGFTDACVLADGRIVFLAAAEDSPDAIADGAVSGSLIGILDEARAGVLLDERGKPAELKAEGVAVDPESDRTLWVVLDPDDPDRPAELCRVELVGG